MTLLRADRSSPGRAARHFAVAAAALLAAVTSAAAAAVEPLDRRIERNVGFSAPPSPAQRDALVRLADRLPDLATTHDAMLGTTRTLSRRFGYLTTASKTDALEVGLGFVREHLDALGLRAADLEFELSDRVISSQTGATHIYLRQVHAEIPVLRGQLQFAVAKDGRLLSLNNGFVPSLATSLPPGDRAMGFSEALAWAAADLGTPLATASPATTEAAGPQQVTTISDPALSNAPVVGRLAWLPVRRGAVRLVWTFTIRVPNETQLVEYAVDAHDGEIWLRRDLVEHDSYRVHAAPLEGPHSGPRSLVEDPSRKPASPWGWHDTNGAAGPEHTTTQGNNGHVYTDFDHNDVPDPGSSPDGGVKLIFDRPLDGTSAPEVINAYYWTNLVHDVQHGYGFDEPAGNFQANNYGRGGLGSDAVRVELTGEPVANAGFLSFEDGYPPVMTLHAGEGRPAAWDSTVIVHEYAHGITQRLLGGPSQVGCGFDAQSASEGWSDLFALAYTHAPGQAAEDRRVIGAFLSGNSGGVRDLPYSLDPEINDWTYESLQGMKNSHAVGQVWAQAMWEVYWRLVGTHGFDPNLHHASGSGGNQRLLRYVTEGLKLAPCTSTFVQLRDAVLQAATLGGGEDVCRMWGAFAAFGLGSDAFDGGSAQSLAVRNGFSVPTACQVNQPPNASFTWSCTGLQCTFDGRASSDDHEVTSFEWAFGDGSTGTGPVVSKSYAGGGTYQVVLTVRDSSGLTHTSSRSVVVTAPPIQPRGGAWYNPARSGNGFGLSRASNGELVMIWYTFRPDGTPVWYASETGHVSGTTWSRPLWEFTRNGSASVGQQVGQVSLTFSDPEHATFAWTLHGVSGSEPYQWLFGGEGRTGAWYAPSEPGWGFEVWEQSATTSTIMYVFASDGRPTWTLGAAASGPLVTIPMAYYYGPGLCPSCGGNTPPSSTPAGDVLLAITSPWSTEGQAATSLQFPGGSWVRPWMPVVKITSGQ